MPPKDWSQAIHDASQRAIAKRYVEAYKYVTAPHIIQKGTSPMSSSKVYVITSGCYSDYHIVRIFSTKELADQFCNKYSRPDPWEEYSIEEHTLDNSIPEQLTDTYVQLKPDGSVMNTWTKQRFSDDPLPSRRITLYHNGAMSIHIAAQPNREKAIKAAQDLRAAYLAQEAGIS